MASLTIDSQATVPANSTFYLIIEEDVGADGTIDNTARVQIPDGTNSQNVSGFDATKGNEINVYRDYRGPTTEGISVTSIDVKQDTGTRNVTATGEASSSTTATAATPVVYADAESTVESSTTTTVSVETALIVASGESSSGTTASVQTVIDVNASPQAESRVVTEATPIVYATGSATSEATITGKALVNSPGSAEATGSSTVSVDADVDANGEATSSSTATVSVDASVSANSEAESTIQADPGGTASVTTTGSIESTVESDGIALMDAAGSIDSSTYAEGIPVMDAIGSSEGNAIATVGTVNAVNAPSSAESTLVSSTGVQSSPDAPGQAETTTRATVPADELDTIDTTRQGDTVSVSWTITEKTRRVDTFWVQEYRADVGSWETIAELGMDVRSYDASLPDAATSVKYRVSLLVAGTVRETLEDSDTYFPQQSSYYGWDTTISRDVYSIPEAEQGDTGKIGYEIPKTISSNWKDEGVEENASPPATSLAGEGTALANIVDTMTQLDEDGNPINSGGGQWEFGVPQTMRGQVEPDTTVEWPVTIEQTYALRIDDPKYLETVSAFANAQGECDVDTSVKQHLTDDNVVVIGMKLKVKCPSPPSEPINYESSITPKISKEGKQEMERRKEESENPEPIDQKKMVSQQSATDKAGKKVALTSSGNYDGNFKGDYTGVGTTAGYTVTRTYNRSIGIGGSCVPQNKTVEVPVSASLETGRADEFDIRVSYDPSVVDITGITSSRMSSTLEEDNENEGYIRVTGSSPSSISFDPRQDSNKTLFTIDVSVTGNDGDTSMLNVTSQSKLINNGSIVGHVSTGSGKITVGSGYIVPSESSKFGESDELTISTRTGERVSEFDMTLMFPAGPITVDRVVGSDMTINSWNIPEQGVLEVSGVNGSGVVSPDLFTIEYTAYQPESPSDILSNPPTEVMVDGELATLYDTNGGEIATPCSSNTGSITVSGNIEQESRDGNKTEIPEVGIIYWPIYLPVNMSASGLKTSKITEDMVHVFVTSETNPDIEYVTNDIVIGPPDAPSTVRVYGGVKIPKADPQEYPIKMKGTLYIGKFNTATLEGESYLMMGLSPEEGSINMGNGIGKNFTKFIPPGFIKKN